MHTLVIPASLGSRLEDKKFRMNAGISECRAVGVLLLLWQWFSANGTDSMPNSAENRSLLNESIHAGDADWVSLLLEAGVLIAQDEGHGPVITPKDYAVNKPDRARAKGGHTRAAGKAHAMAVNAAKQVVRLIEMQEGKAFLRDANDEDKKRAVAIIMSLNSCLGRRPMNASDYVEELVSDVISIFHSSHFDDVSLRATLAWIRENADKDYRLAQPLSLIIRAWQSIASDAQEDRAPRSQPIS